MRLAQVSYGTAGAAPPLLIIHGLFGSARNWGAIAKQLGQDRLVITVDQRNHGDSPWADTNSYPDMADDLAQVIAGHGGPFDVLGHSMGGKAAMVLALTQPDLVHRLMVADIAPVAYEHSHAHLIDAMRGLDVGAIGSRGAADAALGATIPEAGVRAFLLQSLDLRAQPPRWRLNLDVLERAMPQILGWPDTPGAGFDKPALFLGGARSDYIKSAHRPAIKALFPNAKFAKLPDAGHWLHAEAPRAFVDTTRAWFA